MPMGAKQDCSAVRDVYLEAACGARPPMTDEHRAHLTDCPACHRWVSQLRKLDEGLAGLPVLEPSSVRPPKAPARPVPAWVDGKAKAAGDPMFDRAGLSIAPRRSLRWAWVPAAGAAAALAAVWTMVFVLKARSDAAFAKAEKVVEPAAVVPHVGTNEEKPATLTVSYRPAPPPEVGLGPAYIGVEAMPDPEAAAVVPVGVRRPEAPARPRDRAVEDAIIEELKKRYPDRYREIAEQYFGNMNRAGAGEPADGAEPDGPEMPDSVVRPLFAAPTAPVDVRDVSLRR